MMEANKLVKSLSSKSFLLTPHIERYLASGNFPDEWNLVIRNKKEKRDYGEADIRFSPSSDTVSTVEEIVKRHATAYAEEPLTAAMRITFDCGSMWHEYLENIILAMGFIEPEGVEQYFIKKIERPKGIAYTSGIGDLVGVNIPGAGKWLVDVKTMNAHSFKSMPPYLMEKYVAQINLYGEWFGYKKLMILGVSKDSPHNFKEIIVPFNQSLVDSIYDRWVEAYSILKK